MNFDFLNGQTCSNVEQVDDSIIFTIGEDKYMLYHAQDCCEQVYIESITGDLKDLIGWRINFADESSNEGYTEYGHETWTFYKLGTRKGFVDIRFHGESSGYYSESVSFEKIGDNRW